MQEALGGEGVLPLHSDDTREADHPRFTVADASVEVLILAQSS